MNRTEKQETVANLKQELEGANVVVITHYMGLSVDEINGLRSNMRELGAGFKVTKNSLAKLAIAGTRYEKLADLFTGPTAIAYSNDPVAAAKGAVNFAKENEKLVILGGAIEDEAATVDQLQALAKLPSLDELRAKIVGMINTPATRIAGVLQAPGGQLARVINAYAQKG